MHIHFVLITFSYHLLSLQLPAVVPCRENIIVHEEVAFDAEHFGISPVLSVEKRVR